MNDYEKMRKMNDLAKELKQHGFADSSFEAIEQAGQIYGDNEISHEVKHGLIQSKQDKIAGVEKMSDSDFDKKLKKLQDNIDALTSKMNEMIQAINDMDSRIIQLSKRPAVVEKVIEKQPVQEEKPAPKASTPTVSTEEHHESAHTDKTGEYENQRVGNYQSQDVAIDKMFYFGKK